MLEGQCVGNAFNKVAEKSLSHRNWQGTTSSHNATVCLCHFGPSMMPEGDGGSLLCNPCALSSQSRRFGAVRIGSRGKTGSFSVGADRVLGSWRAEPGSVFMHSICHTQSKQHGWDSEKYILHLPLPFHPSVNNSTPTEPQTKIND